MNTNCTQKPHEIHCMAYWALIAITLVIVIGLRISAFISDGFDYDTYSLMLGAGKGYKEYISSSFGIALKTHYWLSNRIFGADLLAYRIVPAALQLMSIFILLIAIIKLWPDERFMPAFTLLSLAFNSYLLYLASYTMVSYIMDIFIGVVLFLYFLRIFNNEINAKESILLSLILFPFVLFSSIMIVVPLFTGVIALFFWRVHSPFNQNSFPLGVKDLVNLWPFLLIPATHALVLWMLPLANIAQNDRPDMDWMFFYRSNNTFDFYGLISFWLNNTGTLIRGLVKPELPRLMFDGFTHITQLIKYIILAILLFFLPPCLFALKRVDIRIQFTLLFLIITYFGILAGGLLGIYPFGNVRYAGWLIAPLAVVIGYMLSNGFTRVQHFVKRNLTWYLLIPITIGGILLNILYAEEKTVEKRANYSVIEFIRKTTSEKILVSSYNQPILTILIPASYSNSIDIGWGTIYGHGSDGGPKSDSFILFSDLVKNGKLNTITLVAPSRALFTDLYPTWSTFISKNYNLINQVDAPAMWSGEFKYIPTR